VRRLLLGLALLLTPFAFGTEEVVTPHFRVLYEDPELAPYAQRVALEAERALDALVPLFGFQPPLVIVRVEGTTDLYNAFAAPLPRPSLGLRALFPTDISLGYRVQDDLGLLLLHELTHTLQFAYTAGRGGLRLGLVGEEVASPPPSWLVEGLAVWVESEFTTGGRRSDALTRGLVRSGVLSGTAPSLPEASLSTYGGWPGLQTQYLYGVGFTSYLIQKHGFEALLASLRAHNGGGFLRPFSASWEEAVGTDLFAEWAAWLREVRQEAQARTAATRAGERVTETGWFTRAPALSPDGRRLAWVSWPAAIKLAEVGEGGDLERERTLLEDRFPSGLEWLDPHTLLYARPVPRPGRTYSELFTLDVGTGEEAQLTQGARAKLPAPLPDGCILFVRDVLPERAQLRRWCDGETETLWRAPEGAHPVGLAVSEEGRVALSVWERGFVDLALVEEGRLRYLTRDAAQDLDPTWRGETHLVFRADREDGGVFDLYELSVDGKAVARLTRTVGGAFQPEVAPSGLWYAALGGRGYDLAFLETLEPLAGRMLMRQAPPPVGETRVRFPVRPYTPFRSLAPYGWLPTGGGVEFAPFRVALEGSLLGADNSADHAHRVSAGYDGTLSRFGGLYAYARYDYGGGPLRATPRPLDFGVQLGAWPHTPHLAGAREMAVGVKGSLGARLPLDMWVAGLGVGAGLLNLPPGYGMGLDARLEATLSNQRADPWGYRTEGLRGALTGVWSATGKRPSLGAWLDARYLLPVPPVGTLELGAQAGYRPALPLPISLRTDLGAMASVGLRRSFPAELRYGDGLYALERVTLEPRLRAWVDSALHVGGDLTLSLDTVLSYGAPVSLSASVGYASGFWTRFEVRLPL